MRPLGILNIQPAVDRLRTMLKILALLLAVAVFSAPVAANGMHGLSHGGSIVADGEHHHHGDDGSVSTHGSEPESPQPDSSPIGKYSHAHASSAAFDILSESDDGVTTFATVACSVTPAANTPALGTLGWAPQKRPPRTA